MRPGTTVSGSPFFQRQHFAVYVGRYATHVVVHGRQHGYRFARHIDTGEDTRSLGNARQPFMDDFRSEVFKVQVDVILVRTHTAAFADFDGHRTTDHVA